MDAAITETGLLRATLAFAGAFLVGFGAIVLLRRRWRWHRGIDVADGYRKSQPEPVLRVGGLALYAVFVCAFLFASTPGGESEPLLGAAFFLLATAMFVLGFADDLFGLPAWIKLFVQVGVGVAAYLVGMGIDHVSHPLGLGPVDPGPFGFVLTVLWFVAIPNIINLVDGMDGLAGGIALFLCLTLAVVGALSDNAGLLILNCALAGGIVAFLWFNLPPAKVYLGDGGAYLIGFLVAGSSMLTSNKGSVFGPLLVVVIALGFPILDTALAVARRALSGLPVMGADALHLHHRLLTLGFSKRNILFGLYGIFAGLSLLGLSVFLSAGYTLPIVGMLAMIGAIQGLRLVGLPHNLAEARRTFRDLLRARRDVRYAYAMSVVLDHDLDRISEAGAFWERLRDFLLRFGIRPLPDGLLGTPDADRRIVVQRVSDGWLWLVSCPPSNGELRRWERVLRCFQPAIAGARARWGDPLPGALGFVSVESGNLHERLLACLAKDPSRAEALAEGLLRGDEEEFVG